MEDKDIEKTTPEEQSLKRDNLDTHTPVDALIDGISETTAVQNMIKAKGSILVQISLLFLLFIIVTGELTYWTAYNRSERLVEDQTERRIDRVTEEIDMAIKEYPAYIWLLDYFEDHADELDIEYDVEYVLGTETAKKSIELQKDYPDIQLIYATKADVDSMKPEDQKKYAEVAYSWIITRLNEIKRTQQVDFLFVVQTKEPYDEQFFVFSAYTPGATRGTDYEDIYTLGVEVDVGDDQQKAMQLAVQHQTYVADAGEYVDCYKKLDNMGNRELLVGMTYNYPSVLLDIKQNTLRTSIIAMIYELTLLFACLAAIYLLVLRPLKDVEDNIRLYTENKDGDEVRENLKMVTANNEIGKLASEVSSMTAEIDDYLDRIQTITSEKERIETELTLANEIQASSLPHTFPPFPEKFQFDIFASMDPAREVGGDFYDFFIVDENHLAIVMADVSGKGIPAALFMMVAKAIINSSAMTGMPPKDVLKLTNERLYTSNQAEMFVTVWLGILNLDTGVLVASNAGHEFPVIKKPGGDYEVYKDKHGFVVGGMEDVSYTQYELVLEPGTKLFLYTDGVPEATNSSEELFGMDRMVDALNSEKDADVEKILKVVRRSVDDFVQDAEQFDDLTMMCIEYKGDIKK